jgi:hypothetical protein
VGEYKMIYQTRIIMAKNSGFIGRDKKERMKFATDQATMANLQNEVRTMELLYLHKKYLKKLRGSFWNRFICWFTDRNPMMTYLNKSREYGLRSTKTGNSKNPTASK